MTPAEFMDDPNWANFVPESRDAAKVRVLPAHEDCSQLDPQKVAMHLRAGGTLGTMVGYEERPGQIDMTAAIASAFNSREHLMIEADTGVGKSLAYLVPSILWAWTNDTAVVVSTATRNLQSQLIGSDIPRALAVLGDDAAKFKVALLKGRVNYVCLRAVSEFFAPGYWTLSADEKALMPDFIEWLETTPDGDLDRYEGLPRSLLTCPGDECSGRRCQFYSRCFVYKARKAAAQAHLVIVNHALVLAEATAPGSGILPAYGRLVMDEAHHLEDIATEYLSRTFSLPDLTRILNRLLRKGRGKHAGGAIANAQRLFSRGLAGASSQRLMGMLAQASPLIVRVISAAEALEDVSARLLAPSGLEGICRYRMNDGSPREFSLHGLFKPYEESQWRESDLDSARADFEAQLAALVNLLHTLRDEFENAADEGTAGGFGDIATQLTGVAESLVGFANDTCFVLDARKDTHVYWAERVRPEKRLSYLRLVGAPLSVADDLKKMFYEVKDSVVFCSATLRVGNDFKYMSKRLGCTERFRFLTAKSPFDYLRQALVLAPDCLPDPTVDSVGYARTLAETLRGICEASRARALVLFTSYEMMKKVAGFAQVPLADAGMRLLVQGEGLSREAITRHLKEDENVVVFGAQSFWEGVDVAGEALSCVVLARLPFAQRGDPVIEARSEVIERSGGSSFREYSLPEAVIRFRQGFGRLIRTKSDRGVVVVADPRIVTKSYGGTFRKSIPATVHTVTGADELFSRINEFFEGSL